jgi:hypothetical protein
VKIYVAAVEVLRKKGKRGSKLFTFLQPHPKQTETGTANRSGTTKGKPPGPIIMID